MGFILLDFKKREEHRQLSDLLGKYCTLMDEWIVQYTNDDDTPPNREECTTLETSQIDTLVIDFLTEAGSLDRVQEEVPTKLQVLKSNLERRRGRLYCKFSKEVTSLQIQAKQTIEFCLDILNEYETSIISNFPTTKESIELNILEKCQKDCENYIELTYPDGVIGLDSYDDELPDGIPSYSTFRDEMIPQKCQELMKQNQESIPMELEKIEQSSKERFQQQINNTILSTLKDIEIDLADDTLFFLEDDEDAMVQFRTELIASANEYGNSRLE